MIALFRYCTPKTLNVLLLSHCFPNPMLSLCFSVMSPASFNNICDKWFPEVNGRFGGVPWLLIGTKIDLRNGLGTNQGLTEKDALV